MREYLDRVIGLDYQQLLHRNADVQGLAFFLSAVQTGQIGLDDVAVDILSSNEFFASTGGSQSDWVDALYARLLGRAPDPNGASFWTNELGSNALDQQQVAHMFVFSSEHFASETVAWYEGLLNRVPTLSDVSQIVALLNAGANDEAALARLLQMSG
ncbi:MAG TPA: DUF4214 domain-containing protein [Pirellulales bacterium]|nr:DUF4214 domain-containing protein [Pirellulales bacterium]